MKTNQLIAGELSYDRAFGQTASTQVKHSINQMLPAQTNEQALIWQNCTLLLQNCQKVRNIAAKVGIEPGNDPVFASKNLLEVKQQLSWKNRSILIGIAKKFGVLMPTLPNTSGSDLVTQNHLLLLGNGLLLWAIASSLGIKIPAAEQLSGSIIEQNHQLLLANQKAIDAIATKLGATAAPLC